DSKKRSTEATSTMLVKLGGCPALSIAAQCQGLRDTLGSAATMHNAAVGTFIASSVVGVATATYAVISSRPIADKRSAAQVHITPVVSGAGGGVLLGGTF